MSSPRCDPYELNGPQACFECAPIPLLCSNRISEIPGFWGFRSFQVAAVWSGLDQYDEGLGT